MSVRDIDSLAKKTLTNTSTLMLTWQARVDDVILASAMLCHETIPCIMLYRDIDIL